jgi:hypothetical protein
MIEGEMTEVKRNIVVMNGEILEIMTATDASQEDKMPRGKEMGVVIQKTTRTMH